MKIAGIVSRYLLGLIFFVFGLNGFLHFIPQAMPPGTAGQFFGVLFVSHYLTFVFIFELVPAILLLVGRFVPLALTVLGAVIVNILLFHLLMAPSGLPLAVVVTVLWVLTALSVPRAFAPLFASKYSAE